MQRLLYLIHFVIHEQFVLLNVLALVNEAELSRADGDFLAGGKLVLRGVEFGRAAAHVGQPVVLRELGLVERALAAAERGPYAVGRPVVPGSRFEAHHGAHEVVVSVGALVDDAVRLDDITTEVGGSGVECGRAAYLRPEGHPGVVFGGDGDLRSSGIRVQVRVMVHRRAWYP